VQNCIGKIQKGSASALAEAVVSRLGEAAEPLAKVADRTRFLLYTGTITVPETAVYEFEVSDCNGVFFSAAGQAVEGGWTGLRPRY
jgi:hypothetical protein